MAITVPYTEGYGSEQYDLNLRSDRDAVKRIFFVEWRYVEQLFHDLIGTVRQVGESQIRTPPDQHPIFKWLYCQDIHVEGVGIATKHQAVDSAVYPIARVIAIYRFPEITEFQQTNPTTYITEEMEVGHSSITYPGRDTDEDDVTWAEGPDDGESLGDNVHRDRRVSLINIAITIHQWPNPPFGAMLNSCGTVNNATFQPLTISMPKERAIFDGFRSQIDITSEGITNYRVTEIFVVRNVSWNKFLHYNGTFYEVDPKPYELTNFQNLLPGF